MIPMAAAGSARRMQKLASLLVAFLVAAIAAPLLAAQPADVLIRHATIVDVAQGSLLPGQAVATSGDRIVAVGPDAEVASPQSLREEIRIMHKLALDGYDHAKP